MDKNRIEKLLNALEQGLVERQTTLRLAFLAAMAGESIFLLGPPGVAKSLIARRLKYAFKEGKAFEYLMNRFSTPDEIFGPVSIQKLKVDQYHRQTEHYLPGATVVFLDEIWKAGPSIQNTLLTVINEKVYRNGAQEEKLPLKALIAASNELPAEGEGLEALWDRFLVRDLVEGIQDRGGFEEMITASVNVYDPIRTQTLALSENEWKSVRTKSLEVKVPSEVLSFIQIIRGEIEQFNQKLKEGERSIYVSDRRWKKIINLLKTSALLNNRDQIDLMDCHCISYCVWEEPEHIPMVKKWVGNAMENHAFSLGMNLGSITSGIDRFRKEVEKEIYIPTETSKKELAVRKDGLIEVIGLENVVGGTHLKLANVQAINNQEFSVLDVYDSSGKKIRSGQVKIVSKREIEVRKNDYWNNHSEVLLMKERNVKQIKITHKKPHPSTEQAFDKKVSNILKKIKAKEADLDKFVENAQKRSKNNLFVDEEHFGLLESNLRQTKDRLSHLEIQLQKLQNEYKKVQDGKIEVKDLD